MRAPGHRGLVALLGASAALHLIRPQVYEPIVPRRLGSARAWVYGSGVVEGVCAAALVRRSSRQAAALATAGLFVAVFPANVQMAVTALNSRRTSAAYRAATVARLPVQAPLVAVGVAGRPGVGPLVRRRRLAAYGAVTTTTLVALAGAAGAGLAAYFTRRVVEPVRFKPDDLEILEVHPDRVVLSATPDTVVPGRYGLWLDAGAGHAKIGEILTRTKTSVTRSLETVERGDLRVGPARFNQYYVAGDPMTAWDLAFESLSLPSPVGDLPCWLVPGADGGELAGTWAVLIHGRSATREECLRALPVLHRLGVTSLVPGYRNDIDTPTHARGGYHFGGTEWRDVESAVLHAADQGAARIVLFGWSMGGAIALQLLSRSWLAPNIPALVLDSPVIDWHDVLDHAARLNKVPARVGRAGQRMTRHGLMRRAIGLGEPVDLRELDWVRRAGELTVPTLIIHSTGDDVVPSGPSAELGRARPDLVTYAEWETARHTKEWNTDPDRWDSTVTDFLRRALS